MGLQRAVLVFAAVLLIPFTPFPANAQYIYMDTNGNGIHDAGDRLSAGTTSVDVWLNSALNRNGSPAACPTTQFYTFGYILHATGGTISNPVVLSGPGGIQATSTTDVNVEAIAGGQGLVFLGRIGLDATPGASLGFATSTPIAADDATSIGSDCVGTRFDNTLRLGEDWFDSDGLGPANSAPSLTVTGPATAAHGALVCLTVGATDPDAADLLTIAYTGGGPASLNSFTHTPSVSPASAQLCGTPTCAEVGIAYTLQFSVSDGVNPAVTQSRALTITNATPLVTAPATQTVSEVNALTFQVTVTDPDDSGVPLTWSGSAFTAGASMTPNGPGAWTFAWTPCTAGSYAASFSATDGCGATGTAATAITVTPGTRFVRGTVFFDDNGNAAGTCTPELGETGLAGWTVQMRNASNQVVSTSVTNGAGIYQCGAPTAGTYTLRASPPNGTTSYWTRTCPGGTGSQTVALSCAKFTFGINFAQNNVGTVRDLATTASLAGVPRPGVSRYYVVTYQNKGNIPVAGASLHFDLPVNTPAVTLQAWDPRFSPAPVFSPPSMTWTLPNLVPGAGGQVYAVMGIPSAATPGTKLTATSTISPAGDAKPGDNIWKTMAKIEPPIMMAASPNAIAVLGPNAKGLQPEGHLLGSDTLRYHVDFQNTGAASADSVTIMDVLDDDLDLDSLEVVAASHDVTLEVRGRQMIWSFSGINLPASASDEAFSNGFVEYTIRLKQASPPGVAVDNVASVGFDSFPPANTNSVHSVRDSPPLLAHVPDRSAVEGSTTQQALSGSDPEGDPLTFTLVSGPPWASVVTTGATTGRLDLAPQSGDAGTVTLTLGASDGLLTHQQSISVSVFTATGVGYAQQMKEQDVRLQSNRPETCFRLQPVSGDFRAGDIDPTSVVIRSTGTGTATQLPALARVDGASVEEICFSNDGLRALLAGMEDGSTVATSCEGRLLSGERFSATLPLRVSAAAGRLAASLTPNPARGGSVLRFRTVRPGFARVSLHDVKGRLVRTLFDTPTLPPGYHEVAVGGARGEGGHLVSGIYFYRIETAEGIQSGRAIVLK